MRAGDGAVARERARGAERRANAGFPLTVGFENVGGSAYVHVARPRTSDQMVSRRRDRAGGADGRAHRAIEGAGDMSGDESGFFDTRRAADYLGLSHRTLDGYRVSGDPAAFAIACASSKTMTPAKPWRSSSSNEPASQATIWSRRDAFPCRAGERSVA